MCKMSGAEFAESGYCKVAGTGYNKQGPISPPCSTAVDPQCPDWAFDGLWADIRTMTLPYTVQDEYDRAHTPTDVPVLTLENDELTAVVTPQWGGRLWSLTSKSTGRELFYNNRHFQPTNDALRQAYQQGGSEWNFGPQIGHMSDTLTDVFAAALDTERGTVLRVYAMERTTAAVWQVDMLLGNQSTLWLHVKLTNPRPEPIVGYVLHPVLVRIILIICRSSLDVYTKYCAEQILVDQRRCAGRYRRHQPDPNPYPCNALAL